MFIRPDQRGISLIELVMFIMIVSIGIAGILQVLNITTRSSADPLLRKQALAIAESLLEEVQLMPFTFCDPDDANAETATSAADCTGGAGGPNDEGGLPLGPEAGEGRHNALTPFDNVSDYNGLNMAAGAIQDITGLNPGLAGYSAGVTVAQAAYGAIPAADSVLITVTVTNPRGETITLQGYRTRYAPTATP